jgi:hypothetical protein
METLNQPTYGQNPRISRQIAIACPFDKRSLPMKRFHTAKTQSEH